MVKDSSISVTKVSWSPEGNLIGVAFSKHLIHLHAYQAPDDLHHFLEIEAHVGGVNGITFSHPKKRLSVVTCGDDKLMQVWDLIGHKLYTFEVHEAPVYSICPTIIRSIYRLFCCGTRREGDAFLVEWNDHEGAIKWTYVGFQKKSIGFVQFDTTQNHFLAAGEENQIKFC